MNSDDSEIGDEARRPIEPGLGEQIYTMCRSGMMEAGQLTLNIAADGSVGAPADQRTNLLCPSTIQ